MVKKLRKYFRNTNCLQPFAWIIKFALNCKNQVDGLVFKSMIKTRNSRV